MLRMQGKHCKNFKKRNYKKQNKNAIPRYLPKSNENECLHKGLHMNIQSIAPNEN